MKRSLIGLALLACGIAFSCPRAEGQKAVVIHAGRLFDGTSDRLLSNQVIVIQGDRIAEVGPAGSVKIPAGAEEIDLGKATVIPGLIDGHAHMFKWKATKYSQQMLQTNSPQYRTIEAVLNAKKDLDAGFTTMRDCGSMGTMYSRYGSSPCHQRRFSSRSAVAGGYDAAYRDTWDARRKGLTGADRAQYASRCGFSMGRTQGGSGGNQVRR